VAREGFSDHPPEVPFPRPKAPAGLAHIPSCRYHEALAYSSSSPVGDITMRRTLPALVVLLTVTLTHAQETSPLIGQRVVIKYKRPLTIGEVAIEPKDYRAYTVERADGDMLWLVSGGISGWVPKDEVVTLDQAIDYYTQEIRKNPLSWNAYLYRGFVWDLKHDFDRAIADYSEAIRIYPLWANTFNNRGWTYHRLKQYDKAIADYNQAIRLDPKCVLAIVNRGFAWQDKAEYYKAITDFDRALKVDPNYARAHVARAWLYATCPDKKFRDGKLAVESARRACQMSMWREPAKLAVLAAAYAEAGDFKKAVRWQQEANDRYLDPNDRKQGRERLELYKQKEPFRIASGPDQGHHQEDSPESKKWSRFPDPELARRVFAELEERIGELPDGAGASAREAWDRKVASAIQLVSRRHNMKPRDVKAIWLAGNEEVPSETP
jgi:tetratricopeptide (TPR) repeat protein